MAWLALFLLPVGRLSELPLALGGLYALYALTRGDWRVQNDGAARLLVALFACYFIPALCSAPDAVAAQKTWATVAALPRFALYGVFVVFALRDERLQSGLRVWVAALLALWLADGWLQAVTGFSLGGPAEAERLSSVFGADNLKFGPVLAVLSPFLLHSALSAYGRRGLALALILLLGPLLLSGSRAAWWMFALVAAVFAWRLARRPGRGLITLLVALGVLAGAIGVADRWSPAFHARVQRSLAALDGSESAVDHALAGRLPIWRTAVAMSVAHPFNGVGVRGFRVAYAEHAGASDPWVNANERTGASHPHQLLLELTSETGLPGLVAWLAGAWLAFRAWRRASRRARHRAYPAALALLVMTFPLNTHFAFYSAFWGLLFWWLIAYYCAALGSNPQSSAEHVA